MKQQGNAVRAGDHIAYVICADEAQASYAQRAWAPADVLQVRGYHPATYIIQIIFLTRLGRAPSMRMS